MPPKRRGPAYLPIAVHREQPEKTAPATLDAGTIRSVLLVEADYPTRLYLELLLGNIGCGFLYATCVADVGKLLENPVDVVIVDDRLPDGDVLDLARTLRRRSTTVFIVLVTRNSAQYPSARDAGVNLLVQRPIPKDFLQTPDKTHAGSPAGLNARQSWCWPAPSTDRQTERPP
jgi:CheY-like chemotaxis protein